MLMDILKDTLRIAGPIGGYDPQTRLQLTNDLINQQSNDLKEIESTKQYVDVPLTTPYDLLPAESPKKKVLKG